MIINLNLQQKIILKKDIKRHKWKKWKKRNMSCTVGFGKFSKVHVLGH
jgi:hypothetical protein